MKFEMSEICMMLFGFFLPAVLITNFGKWSVILLAFICSYAMFHISRWMFATQNTRKVKE